MLSRVKPCRQLKPLRVDMRVVNMKTAWTIWAIATALLVLWLATPPELEE